MATGTVVLPLIPPGVETVTATGPAGWLSGSVAVIWVVPTVPVTVPATPPKATVLVELNPVPVIVTEVPPATGPSTGEIEVTAGTTS